MLVKSKESVSQIKKYIYRVTEVLHSNNKEKEQLWETKWTNKFSDKKFTHELLLYTFNHALKKALLMFIVQIFVQSSKFITNLVYPLFLCKNGSDFKISDFNKAVEEIPKIYSDIEKKGFNLKDPHLSIKILVTYFSKV